jgi:hypothetical protein
MTLTDTLTGNVIQANTITIGQGDGGEGITVDGHIESDTFKARQHLYTPQGYVEDYTGNNMTLTDTLTGNVINVSNTITSGHIESNTMIITDDAVLQNATVQNQLTTNRVTSNAITTERLVVLDEDDGGISGTVTARADVATGLVIDGDLNQFSGTMFGNAQGLTGFSGKQNTDMEARLRMFASSPHRLFVSTTGSDTNAGNSPDQPFRTIKKALSVAKRLTTVFVDSGEYIEANPMYVPEQVSIVGDSLRNTLIFALDPKSDVFHVDSMTYFTGLRFVDLQAPGYCLAFPSAISDRVVITDEGRISATTGSLTTTLPVEYSPTGYYSLKLPGTAPITTDDVVTARNDLSSGTISCNVVYNSTLLTFSYTGSEEFDIRNLFDTVTVRNSILPSLNSYIIMDKKQYRVSSLNSSVSVTLHDAYKDSTVTSEPFEFGSSVWGPVLQPNTPSVTASDITTHINELTAATVAKIQGNAPTWPTTSNYMVDAASLLVANKAFIQAETIAWIESGELSQWNTTLSSKCRRDVGYIVLAWANDLATGGSDLTEEYTEYYKDGAVLTSQAPAYPNQAQHVADTVKVIQDRVSAIAKEVALGTRITDSKQRSVTQVFSATVPDSGLTYDPSIRKTFTMPGIGPASGRLVKVVGSDQARGHSVEHVVDFSSVLYKSAGVYRNFNGIKDAADVYIDIEFPYETMIVGYALEEGHNLKKWQLLARETPYTDWKPIDTVRQVPRKTDFAAIEAAIQGMMDILIQSIDQRALATPDDAVLDRDSGYVEAAEVLVRNRAFIQEEAMVWVNETFPTLMTPSQRNSCKRDVGYIIDGIANDLMTGGASMTLDYTRYYLRQATLPDDQVQPTVRSMEYVRDLAINVASKTKITPTQTAVNQSFDRTSFSVTVTPRIYRTTATTKYSYYRLQMLQNTDDGVFMVKGIQLHEFDVPKTLCDGPALGGSKIERIEVINKGKGYETTPQVIIEHVNPNKRPVEVKAKATAHRTGGEVTSITLDKLISDKVERIELNNPGSGYTAAPTVTIDGSPTGDNATAKAFIDKTGKVTELILLSKGSGYTNASPPTLSIQGSATGTAYREKDGLLQKGRGYITESDNVDLAGAVIRIEGGEPADPTNFVPATAIAVMEDDYCEIECPVFLNTSQVNMDIDGRIKQINIVEHGSGYSVEEQQEGVEVEPLRIPPTISIQPPLDKRPFITGSPYCQNSSNISGPFTTTGEKIPATLPLPFPVNNVFNDPPGSEVKLDAFGGGGGCRIDGNCCAASSPLRSMVMDAFTQVSQGCIGFLLTNFAYAQFVSTFSTFSAIHFLTLEGSFCNASNSVTDFGLRGLVSRGKARVPYLTGKAIRPIHPSESLGDGYEYFKRLLNDQYVEGQGYRSSVEEVRVEKRGEGYSDKPKVEIDPPAESGVNGAATAVAEILDAGFDAGQVLEVTILEDPPEVKGSTVGYTGGMGYRIPPTVSFKDAQAGASEAEAKAILSGVRTFRVEITDISQRPNNDKPDVSSIVRIHGRFYTVQDVSLVKTATDEVVKTPEFPATQWDVTIGGVDLPPYIDEQTVIEFFVVSFISTGSHVFEYSGSTDQSGCSYNSLPQFGGVPVENYQIIQQNRGRVTYTSSDHLGVFRVGKNFSIDQTTGAITFNLENAALDLTGLERISFRKGDALEEFSDNPGLIGSQGIPGPQVAASQNAIVQYISDKSVPRVGAEQQNGHILQIRDKLNPNPTERYGWAAISLDQVGVTQAVIRADVINGLVADGDAKIVGNMRVLTADDTTVTVESAEGKHARVDVLGEKTGSSSSTVFVGPTLEEGGGVKANVNSTMLFTQSTGTQEKWTAKNDHGTPFWEFAGPIGLTSPNGTRFWLKVDDSGNLSVDSVYPTPPSNF